LRSIKDKIKLICKKKDKERKEKESDLFLAAARRMRRKDESIFSQLWAGWTDWAVSIEAI
jgi:hypothetical protein